MVFIIFTVFFSFSISYFFLKKTPYSFIVAFTISMILYKINYAHTKTVLLSLGIDENTIYLYQVSIFLFITLIVYRIYRFIRPILI